MKLFDAMNTWSLALSMIEKNGYKICIRLENNKIVSYKAVNDKNEIIGINPLVLLGLVNIAEEYSENWNKVKTGNLCNKLIEIELENIKTSFEKEPEFEYGKIVVDNYEELLKKILDNKIKLS